MDRTSNGTEVEGAGRLPRDQSESGVLNGRNLNHLPVLLPEIVDADALPLLTADPAFEVKLHNVTGVRVSGTLPESAHPKGSTK